MANEAHRLRIFLVDNARAVPDARGVMAPHVQEMEAASIAEPKGVAKEAAKRLIAEKNLRLRGIQWGPDDHPAKPDVLIAYVEKEPTR